MLMNLLFGFACLSLSPKRWVKARRGFYVEQIFRFLMGLFYGWIVTYFVLVDASIWAFLFWAVIPLAIGFSWDLVRGGGVVSVLLLVVAALFGIFLIIWFGATTEDRYQLVVQNAEVIDDRLESIDIQHIVVVPEPYAYKKSQQLLGQLPNPSFYKIGNLTKQKIGDELFWVAPLEYASFWKARSAKMIPGYIKVSAEDETANAVLVLGYQMQYVPSAYFGSDLMRKVRKAYPTIILMEASFEPDDTGRPFYAVTFGHYQKGRWGRVVEGIILFDPQTGEMQKYELGEVPSFVDQLIPADLAEDYNKWYGKNKHGFWTALFGNAGDLHQPTTWGDGEEVVGVYGTDGNMYWFTDHTTLNDTDTSIVGYSMLDARTGKMYYYTGARGFKNGDEAIKNVNNTFIKENWSGAQPVLYGIYGQDTWVIPVLDGYGEFRELSLVHAETGKVVHSSSKSKTFQLYKQYLATGMIKSDVVPTPTAEIITVQGIVKRVTLVPEIDTVVVKLLLEDDDRIFTIPPEASPYAVFTSEGDSVVITCIDNTDVNITARDFSNSSIE